MGLCKSIFSRGSSRSNRSAESSSAGSPQGGGRASIGHQSQGSLSGLQRSTPSGSLAPRSALSAEQRAVDEALSYVRTYYYNKSNLKSSNKKRISGGSREESRVSQARAEILRMREEQFNDSEKNVIEVAMDGRAHNCEELARLAVYRLQENGWPARVADFGSVHAVAVVGGNHGQQPGDMTQWASDIYVCDPWCNIACRARDYPEQFLAKMGKWQQDGKQIKYSDEAGFVSPLEQQWMSRVLHAPKVAY